MCQEGRPEHGDGGTDEAWVRTVALGLLSKDAVGPRGVPTTAVLGRPGQGCPTLVGQGALPGPSVLEVGPGIIIIGEPGDLPGVDLS